MPASSSKTLRYIACLVLAPAALLGACSDDSGEEPLTPSAGAAGGGGTSSAGASFAGGGGQSGGGQSAGGKGGQGSAGETSVAGSIGSGGEQSSAGTGSGGEGTTGGAGSFDDCFDGLRAAEGQFQDAVKVSADTTYRMRLALETGDRFGTSGSVPWLAFRLALETPDEILCVTDEVLLAAGYAGTHHNCTDVLTFSQGQREYTITNPDSAIDYVDPQIWVRPSMLTISEAGDTIAGPIRLDTVECYTPDQDGLCRSGGPC